MEFKNVLKFWTYDVEGLLDKITNFLFQNIQKIFKTLIQNVSNNENPENNEFLKEIIQKVTKYH